MAEYSYEVSVSVTIEETYTVEGELDYHDAEQEAERRFREDYPDLLYGLLDGPHVVTMYRDEIVPDETEADDIRERARDMNAALR